MGGGEIDLPTGACGHNDAFEEYGCGHEENGCGCILVGGANTEEF